MGVQKPYEADMTLLDHYILTQKNMWVIHDPYKIFTRQTYTLTISFYEILPLTMKFLQYEF